MPSEKVGFMNGEGQELAGRLELPEGEPRAFALFAHCFTCSKDVAAASRIARELAKHGVGVLRFDFTGLGNSEGDFANTDFSSNVADLLAAAEHLRATHRAPSLLVGHSLGGAAVLMAAPQLPEVRAVVTIGAPSEPQHLKNLLRDDEAVIRREGRGQVSLGGREFTIRREFLEDLERQDLGARLGELGRALLVMHSPLDETVGVDHARRLYEAAMHPKSFVSLDQADHLLSNRADSRFAARVIAAWSSRYVSEEDEPVATPAAALRDGAGSDLEAGSVLVRERGGLYANDVLSRRHAWIADEPLPAGKDLGPDPYAHLLAALGACTSMTLRMYADRKSWPLERVSVLLRHDRIHAKDCADCESTTGKIDRIRREITVAGALDEAQRARLLEIADRCPVHRTLENEKRIETTLGADG